MTANRRNQRKWQQEISRCKRVLPMLAELVESGRISARLAPLADVRAWLRQYEACEKSRTVIIDAARVRMERNDRQFDLRLDDYAS
jgi:hypothetical protein